MVNSTVPAFRKPWEYGAHAYPEADTFAAALEGFRRVRTDKMFHMTNTGEAGRKKCAACGIRLDAAHPVNEWNGEGETKVDKWSTWNYDAKRKTVTGGLHYICSWGDLLQKIMKLPR